MLVGNFKNELLDGFGKVYMNEWLTYEGEWVNGRAQGQGIGIDAFGNKYLGRFKDDMKHGYGVENYANGDIYKGDFLKDEK